MVKNPGDTRDVDWILGSGRSPGAGHGNPFQYYRGAWRASSEGCKEPDVTELPRVHN